MVNVDSAGVPHGHRETGIRKGGTDGNVCTGERERWVNIIRQQQQQQQHPLVIYYTLAQSLRCVTFQRVSVDVTNVGHRIAEPRVGNVVRERGDSHLL